MTWVFCSHLRFFTIVDDFNVRHQPCYEYDYDLLKSKWKSNEMYREITKQVSIFSKYGVI